MDGPGVGEVVESSALFRFLMFTLADIILWLPKRRFRRATDIKLRQLEETIRTIREQKERALKRGATTLITLHDATLYLMLLSLDHTVLLYNLAIEERKLVKTVYSKCLILLLSEFFDDFPDVLGKKIRRTVDALPNSGHHIEVLDEIYSGLRSYRKTHEKDFRRIRNIVGAHRDLNGELQLSTLEAIDHKMIQTLAGDFDSWLSKVFTFLATVLQDYSRSFQMVREICKNIENGGDNQPID